MARKPIHIFKISRNYTRCEIWWGSRMIHNRLGTSVLVPDKGMTRQRRYEVIAQWLYEQTGVPAPSFREVNK